MKKQIIATLVGGLILFVWQFLSWSMLNVHGAETQYTPNQEAILKVLSENLEAGTYFMPNVPPGTAPEEYEAMMSDAIGKPWAQVNYHPEFGVSMGTNLMRGFAVNLLSVWLLVWVLLNFRDNSFGRTLMATLAIGAIGYFTITYLESVWYEIPTIGYIIDVIVEWGLVGSWLGWYLNR